MATGEMQTVSMPLKGCKKYMCIKNGATGSVFYSASRTIEQALSHDEARQINQ